MGVQSGGNHRSRNMLLAVVVTLFAVSAEGMELDSKTWGKINRYNLMSFCYGEKWVEDWGKMIGELSYKCFGKPEPAAVQVPVTLPIQLTTANLVRSGVPAYTMPGFVYSPLVNQAPLYGRKKREAAADMASQDEINSILVGLGEYKKSMDTKIGNLSCVLQEMEILDAAGNINPADISNAWPLSSLSRNEFMMKHGRQHIFFTCMKKAEVKLCGKYQIYKYMEYFLGNTNLPGDKFDIGTAAYNVYVEQTAPELNFIDDFFWGENEM